MNFKSDNTTAISPEIMEAIQKANHGFQPSYGCDLYSLQLQERLSELFETPVSIYLTNTGTAANSLSLSALVAPYELIYCHEEAHIQTDECGAPEFFTGGAKLLPIPGKNGKIDSSLLQEHLGSADSRRPHGQRPGAISVTQSTECGTVYSVQELEEIGEIAMSHKVPLHMDGARFANAMAFLGCGPSHVTWRAGIDVLSFGGTKNGALAAEMVILFNPKYAEFFDYRHKRAGQLFSKTRFFATQFLALFENDLWLRNASHANQMALVLQKVFQNAGINCLYPVESNSLFPQIPSKVAQRLVAKGVAFYEWGGKDSGLYRFVTSCFTTPEEVKTLEEALGQVEQ